MNRTVFIVWLLVFYLALVAGWSVHAHNSGHPVPDNMCGRTLTETAIKKAIG